MIFKAVMLCNLVGGSISEENIQIMEVIHPSKTLVTTYEATISEASDSKNSTIQGLVPQLPLVLALVLFCLIYMYKFLICGSDTNKHHLNYINTVQQLQKAEANFGLVSVPITNT
jgi:hypothetical protein